MAVILVHGVGRTLADFGSLAPLLAVHHRVVAMDLRGHGRSGEGGWAWDDVVGDVHAVAHAYGFDRPAVVGHSLGGIVAAMCGERGACRAVVNIDGHFQDRLDQYVGMQPAEVAERLAELKALGQAMWQGSQGPLGEEAVEQGRQAARAEAATLGLDPDLAVETFERGLRLEPGGIYRRRPAMSTIEPLNAAVEGYDLLGLYRRVSCPLLIFNAVAAGPAAPGTPEWLSSLMAAFRQGLRRDLGLLAANEPQVVVREVDATHMLIVDHPELVAGEVVGFLAQT